MTAGIRLDHAGVDREPVALDQASLQTNPDDTLEHETQKITVAKGAVTVLRKAGMIGNAIVQIKPTEPSIG
jgi:hypothetical protein